MMGECGISEFGYNAKRSGFGTKEYNLTRRNRNPLLSGHREAICRRNPIFFEDEILDTPITDNSGQTGQLNKFSSNDSTDCTQLLPVISMMPSAEILAEGYASSFLSSYHNLKDLGYPKSLKKLSCSVPFLRSTVTMEQYNKDRLSLENRNAKPKASSWLSYDSHLPLSYSEIHRGKIREVCKVSAYLGPRYLITPQRAHWRGFHSTAMSLDKSNSDEPTGCRELDDICGPVKDDDCGKPCKKKNACLREKVKCEKTKKKLDEPKKQVCRDTCLPRGKCELFKTEPLPKMTYEKVTCPTPKFPRLAACPPLHEKDIKPPIEINSTNRRKKKKVCTPPPLPKPPCTPVLLCPCAPPPKIHPGMCPCYESKIEITHVRLPPCPPKKPYPCPVGVHYCPPEKCEKPEPCEKDKPRMRKP